MLDDEAGRQDPNPGCRDPDTGPDGGQEVGPSLRRVAVEVAPLWVSPESPGPLDAAVVADVPDHGAWLEAMDTAPQVPSDSGPGMVSARLTLLGRLESEALRGEPAVVLEERGGWTRVALPLQPSHKFSAGYPGWVRSAHLGEELVLDSGGDGSGRGTWTASASPYRAWWPPAAVTDDGTELIRLAREKQGLFYLWAGISGTGLDCSGLVHWAHRQLGLVVPRDADDQAADGDHLPVGEARPGDLYFFANSSGGIHHVALCAGDGKMLHSPGTGKRIEEIVLDEYPLRHELVGHASRYAGVGWGSR